MKKIYLFLVILHAFVGVGALFGGFGAIMDPSGEAMGISTDVLKRAPFADFLIPGLILFIVIGIGNLVIAFTAYKKVKLQAYFSGAISFVLMIWIVIQCYMLADINILHIIYFLIGFIGIIFSVILAFKRRLFPTKIIINLLNKYQ